MAFQKTAQIEAALNQLVQSEEHADVLRDLSTRDLVDLIVGVVDRLDRKRSGALEEDWWCESIQEPEAGKGSLISRMPGSGPASDDSPSTTTRAAALLGMSRPFLIRLLDEGAIPFHMVGTARRISLADIEHYRVEREMAKQQFALKARSRQTV